MRECDMPQSLDDEEVDWNHVTDIRRRIEEDRFSISDREDLILKELLEDLQE